MRDVRLLTTLLALTLVTPAHAEEPHVTCTAQRTGTRVLVRPEARAFIDAELDRLLRLGLAGRLEVGLVLLRRRPAWFDARLAEQHLTEVLRFDESTGRYELSGRPLSEGPAALQLERAALELESPPAPDAVLEVELDVRLQVVTRASLGRMASWLTQSETRSAVTENLLRTVADDLQRRARARCRVQPGPPSPPGRGSG
ncbi:hypothetical protein FGE12_22395 [Aggregicoccus sp. 17bor-14]|uniref:hypothetical protein n=1 Tax=Myxococcaceae TaxID=31 RepID=UPI0012F438A1|nr:MULTISPECIES: hypothetical protein [Myxococcaceae]MBF5045171.1 hypothetical protein [Simulacricoccus sp. 17bor-14]MRI90912.1 hypothetical protein [Aggregicoccus sp. 17bor-14]